MTDGQGLFIAEVQGIREEFKGVMIIPKDSSWLCKAIAGILHVLTWGKSTFMEDYTTVLGLMICTPRSWHTMSDMRKFLVLRHKRTHLRQARRLGKGRFWLGYPIWALSYLFLLPAVWTMRAHWEREAYAEIFKLSEKYGLYTDREHVIRQFTGPQYFYMWPFYRKVKAWFDSLA